MSAWQDFLNEHQTRFLDELLELLRIPSIAYGAEGPADVRRAAAWVATRLTAAGLEAVSVLSADGTPDGRPLVYGEWLHAPDKPTVLLYGHFDVHAAGALDRWTTPPFAPDVREGRVYGRGTADSKGNLLPIIAAVEALLHTAGALPVNVKVLVEGQEEIGSPDLPSFIGAHRQLLSCDLVVNTDGGRCGTDPPQLIIGARGCCYIAIEVRGPRPGLHAGNYGGPIQNPVNALVWLLSSLHAAERVQVAGFYDDVLPLSLEHRALLAELPFDETAFKEHTSVRELVGEPEYTPVERLGARPLITFGNMVDDWRTGVIPSVASARIMCILVPNQDPARIADLVRAHLATHAVPGVTVSTRVEVAISPYLAPHDHPGIQIARDLLGMLRGTPAVLARLGGILPVSSLFYRHLGAHVVFFGFLAGDENGHGADEFIRLSTFADAQTALATLLQRLGQETPDSLRE
jgi:acetylornithine deacetylase/succinyl-diaminopimelate desuccinylase-like protein